MSKSSKITVFFMICLMISGLSLSAWALEAKTPSSHIEELETKANAQIKQGDFLLSALHQPINKDFYQAAMLYREAALNLEEVRTAKIQEAKTNHQDDLVEKINAEYSPKIEKLRMDSDQARRMSINRETRGLL